MNKYESLEASDCTGTTSEYFSRLAIFIYGVYPYGRVFAANKYYYFYVYQVVTLALLLVNRPTQR